jgi:BirA family biotin operon repressor/biotin-[acetyl-CoA-carboxylase] ligase
MTDQYDILRKIARGEAVSNSKLHRRLVDEFGLEVTIDGDDLRLETPLELLDPDSLLKLIKPAAQSKLSRLDIHWSLDSTNRYVLDLATSTEFHGYACLAERQTSGRGRRGRYWVSPFGKNIYLSMGWTLPADQPLDGLSLAIGACVAKAITSVSQVKVSLKWPNDILLNGGKAGGILVEIASGDASTRRLVIGVGINLSLSSNDAGAIDQPWSVIENVSRNELAAALVTEISMGLEGFSQLGFEPFRSAWQALDAHEGQEVSIISNNSAQTGISLGVNESGNLMLETSEGIKAFNAGEVSLRSAKR